eukprot:scaffold69513_cov76-Cyclotella_meneghiniana.AAC.3
MDPPIKPRRDPEEQSLDTTTIPRNNSHLRNSNCSSRAFDNHHYHYYNASSQDVPPKQRRRHSKRRDSESVSYSSGSGSGKRYRQRDGGINNSAAVARRNVVEGESPISSLNSSLSYKLGRLDRGSSGSNNNNNNNSRGRNVRRTSSKSSYDDEDYLIGQEAPMKGGGGGAISRGSSNSLHRRMQKPSRRGNEYHHRDETPQSVRRSSGRRNSHDVVDDYIQVEQEVLNYSSRNNSFSSSRLHKSRSGNSHIEYYVEEEDNARRRQQQQPARMRKSRSGSRTSTYNYDNNDEPSIQYSRQSRQSSNSLKRSGGGTSSQVTRVDYLNNQYNNQDDDVEDDDYFVGEEVHVKQHHSHRKRPSLRSYDSSSYLIYDDDDDTSDNSVRDAWSMAKSAFSALPHRQSLDIYDDEASPSPNSSRTGGGGGSSSYNSRGNNNNYYRSVSRSSSIHSHLSGQSQSSLHSQNSYSRQVTKRFANGKHNNQVTAYDESDHSMDSILSGHDLEMLAGMDDSWSDRSRSMRDGVSMDGGVQHQPRDASPSVGDETCQFQYKLFDLEGLGIEFEVVSDDNEDEYADDEASLLLASEEKVDIIMEQDRPWWIQHFEEEGLFEHDTSTVYSRKMPAKHQFGRDVHHDLVREIGDAAVTEANNQVAVKDGSSDTSTVGAADDDVGDWEERLWTLARRYYKEYNALSTNSTAVDEASVMKSIDASAPTLSDEATIQEQEKIFTEVFESEQRGVLYFRSVLLTCITAYVEAFHRDVKSMNDATKRKDGIELEPEEDDGWNDSIINLDVDHYVPLVTARSLFEKVIKLIDDGTISLGANDGTKDDSNTSATIGAKEKAEFVSSMLVEEEELRIFRKYVVKTIQEPSFTSVAKQPNRKLFKPFSSNTFDGKSDHDTDLYGDMLEEEKKEDDGSAPQNTNDSLETEECEIRIRSVVARMISDKVFDLPYTGRVSWADIMGKVMLSSVQGCDATSEKEPQDKTDKEGSASNSQDARLKHTEPLAELYALRHTPNFLLRALAALRQQHIDGAINLDDLKSLMTNKVFIGNRFDLIGPYNATILHVSNYHDEIAYQSNLDRCNKDDTEDYLVMHEFLVSALYSHLETTLYYTGYQLNQVAAAAATDGSAAVGDFEIITINNYANTVAICLEVGRALHYLGLGLGRRQRDASNRANLESSDAAENVAESKNRVSTMEIAAYRNALEAYKACMYIFSKVEQHESTSARGNQDDMQQLRDAKISVELHLADTLIAIGFVHDTKMEEKESALMAYRESLSIYIRHVGRFHKMVSNTLHNMGTIHSELKQWSEAASCYRQCLSIINRVENQEKSAWERSCSREAGGQGFVSSINEDIACCLEGLGTSLAMLGEYDASLVCLEQAIGRISNTKGNVISFHRANLLSQAGNIVMQQASSLSFTFNWECHNLLFSNSSNTSINLHLTSSSLKKKEQNAYDFIQKAIASRRHQCYKIIESNLEISLKVTAPQLHALAEDLIMAGRLEFRKRGYTEAISYFYEALAITTLGGNSSDNRNALHCFDSKMAKNGESYIKVSDNLLSLIEGLDENTTGDGCELVMQILYLIGTTHARSQEYDKGNKALSASLVIANARAARIKESDVNILHHIAPQIDVAVCHLMLALLASKQGDTAYLPSLKYSIEVLNTASNKLSKDEEDDDQRRKYLEIIINSCLATAWYLLGRLKMVDEDSTHAMKCYEKTIKLLNKTRDIRSACQVPNTTQSQFSSSLFWEETSALTTSTILADANQFSGEISTDDLFCLDCFLRAIEIREQFVSKFSSIKSVDSENFIEPFDESQWDMQTLSCYSSLLVILESRNGEHSNDIVEEKSIKSQDDLDSPDVGVSKEDILFRMGNLQAKLGLLKEAIISFQDAKESTVHQLGNDHIIVADINYNLGNAFRQLSVSSVSPAKKESARDDAMTCYTESICISSALYGKRHISLAECILNQGLLYMESQYSWFNVVHEERGDDEKNENLAFDFLKRSLNIRRNDKDNNDGIELAFNLYLLGLLCLRIIGRDLFRLDADVSKLANDGINYFIEALKIQTLLLGESHMDVVNTLQCLGHAYFYRALGSRNKYSKFDGDLAKALESLNSSFEMRASTQTPTAIHNTNQLIAKAHCLYLLGHIEEVSCNFSDSKSHYIEALRLLKMTGKHIFSGLNEKTDGRQKMNMETVNLLAARVLNHMAIICDKEGSTQQCLTLLHKSAQVRKSCYSVKPNGISSAMIYSQIACVLLEQKNADKAVSLLIRSLPIYINQFGKDNLNVAETLNAMGRAFSIKSRFQKSLLCYDKAIRIYEFKEQLAPKEKLGDIHSNIGRNMMLLGADSYDVLEHYRSSVSYLEALGSDDINTKLVTVYSEMLDIIRDAHDIERDQVTKSELLDEIGDVLHRLGNLYASSRLHKQAMACFKEVLEIHQMRQTGREELRIADLLFNMGNIYVELKEPERALKCLEESYGITKAALGGNHKELHSTMYLMGVALVDLGNYEGSLEWFSQAISTLDSITDEEEVDNSGKGLTLYRLGQVYQELGDDSKAFTNFQECVKILKAARCNDVELSNALYLMGTILHHNEDYEEALNCYDQSLNAYSTTQHTSLIKESIGVALSCLGDYHRSLKYLVDALHMKTKELDNIVSFDAGRLLMNIGQIYFLMKDHGMAKNFFEEALSMFEKGSLSRSLDVAVCFYAIGVIQDETAEDGSLENYLMAIQKFREEDIDTSHTVSLAMGLKKYDHVMAKCLHMTAKSYVAENNYEDGLHYMNEAYAMKKDVYGTNHEETAESRHWLGVIHLALNDVDIALALFKGALKTRVNLFGTENNSVAETLYGLAEVHFKRNELHESIECINENLRLASISSLNSNVNMIPRSKLMLGSCYQELGQYEKAKTHLLESIDLLTSVHGGNRHLDIADAHFRLGICDCETNELDSSEEHFRTAALLQSSLLGDLDIELANTYESLGIVQQKKLCHDDAITAFEKALAIKRTSLPEIDEDIALLLHFIGTSMFAIEKYNDALQFFTASADMKKELYGMHDSEYALALLDKAAALAKVGDDRLSMECYSDSIQSGGLPQDSWELGVAYKSMAKYFYDQNAIEPSFESYSEALSIFEWILENEQPSNINYEDVIDCYVQLLEMGDEPISEDRGITCYKLANCYVQISKLQGKNMFFQLSYMLINVFFNEQ